MLGKYALWRTFSFSRIKKAFFLHIAGSNPVGTAYLDNLMIFIKLFFLLYPPILLLDNELYYHTMEILDTMDTLEIEQN